MKEAKVHRIEWVDVAKAVGILLVVYGHVLLGAHDAGLWSDTLNYRIQHSVIYTTHMPLFFFLSGIFAIKWVQRTPKIALTQKLRSLIIPYFVWGFIQAIVMQVVSKNTNNGQGISNALQLPFIPYAQFWFLYDLFWIFLIYYLVVHVFHWSDKLVVMLAIVLFILSPYCHVWEFWRIFYHFIFFIAGTYVLKHQDLINRFKLWQTLIVAAVLNVILFVLPQQELLITICSFFVAIAGIFFLINVSKLLKTPMIEYIGRNSMAIYVMHIIFTAGTRVFLIKLGHGTLLWVLPVGVLAGMIGPLVVFEVLKRLKINQYLF
ncbi:acyltransferase family protein [Fructobacillus durionis]|uniref:Fucose 4-O-acetylase n=1 Tax=Fructobacillus durionis TaxID=283737 RepID=A0A1I1E2I2_9LACO|nr:acyltransferase [Fructobacillus durionis]SFB81277.1 Fucose 4-O-acetylase [Fructobacillus durionis]